MGNIGSLWITVGFIIGTWLLGATLILYSIGLVAIGIEKATHLPFPVAAVLAAVLVVGLPRQIYAVLTKAR